MAILRFVWNILNVAWQKQMMPISEKSIRKYNSLKSYSSKKCVTFGLDSSISLFREGVFNVKVEG